MDYKIVSWNVAGLRAMVKKPDFEEFINNPKNDFTIICLQETKCEESQVKLPEFVTSKYPYRYWRSCDGTSQRKGLNGVTIWSKIPPLNIIKSYEFDNEGRLLILEFEKFRLINVYTPNSQKFQNERYYFREAWNKLITELIQTMNNTLPTLFCGDFNVANEHIDIVNPKQKINKVPGFFDNEREQFKLLLNTCELLDTFREKNPILQQFTYWSNFLKQERSHSNGWRIDYFLCSKNIIKNISESNMMMEVKGSDHCPLYVNLKI
tara:strand:+ start:1312 stop:2106 length:795 start_codon:yes stop_codon:yes gene_type:complete